ncbi:phage scaffolding protein [Gracilibacillus thailandensis]|uniref:Scaffolding protein n=1 Tax=Gracilibacillus thailandensis TaxID=563735 RepID=A0A6N7R2I2_9BACI|nr:phage scaffolding protein [Gracilibacillus thailandensis]MRI65156.1 scaffolding protein [Gracilibacillus thailandensis]
MDLKELLGEELYNQVKEKAGDEHKIAIVSDGSYIPKDKFDQVNQEKNDYKKQVSDRDKQLDDLKTKATGNEDLQAQIQQLQDDNKKIKDDYEAKIQKQTFDYTLKDALQANKVRNPKAVQALLDTESIKLDGDKLLGLDDQLKNIKESDPYLFQEEQQEPPKPSFTTGNHQKQQGNGEPSSLGEALAQKFAQKQ